MQQAMQLYNEVCNRCSEIITKNYSTSFSFAIKTLDKKFHRGIYAVYGFVRLADEIVDTFHDFDKVKLLKRFREDTYIAIKEGISLNPVLNSFQWVVNEYNIDIDLIDAFLDSMQMDLFFDKYDCSMYGEYIYGSAEVVGLMCLKVFVEGDIARYEELREPAKYLGSAFQKVNFLRDMKSDFQDRGRVYFPGVKFNAFCQKDKREIEKDIEEDFEKAYDGIMNLPEGAKFGVHTAYVYYQSLFKKIKKASVDTVLQERIRIPNDKKVLLLISNAFKRQFRIL